MDSEKYKFDVIFTDKVNKNLNLMFVFANLNKAYGKMGICVKIREWYTEILQNRDVDETLAKTNSSKKFLQMIKERLEEDKDYYSTMYRIRKYRLFSKLYYKHKLENILECLPIIDEVDENNIVLRQAALNFKQTVKAKADKLQK